MASKLIAAQAPADRARDLWVHGSYARGAPDVGDLDLVLRVDEYRAPGQQAIESYYRRAHPYSEIVKALGCGGSSIVNLHIEPVSAPAPPPISPERLHQHPRQGHEVPDQPRFCHAITGDPFDPLPRLLWVRGDDLELVRARLAALPNDLTARRFERTTTVPLTDTLLEILGARTAFTLAAQIRAGNLNATAHLLPTSEPPTHTREHLDRYTPGSERHRAAAAALAHLHATGVDLDTVRLAGHPITPHPSEQRVEVSLNAFLIHELASHGITDDWRHLHIWARVRNDRVLALDLHVNNARATSQLSLHLTNPYADQTSYDRIRQLLGRPPLPPPPPR